MKVTRTGDTDSPPAVAVPAGASGGGSGLGAGQGCLVSVAVLVVSAVALLWLLVPRPWQESDLRLWVAIGAAACFAAATATVLGIPDKRRDVRRLRDALAGTPPVDGTVAAFVGTIESRHWLEAPVSGERVIAYRYELEQRSRSRSGSTDARLFEGCGLVPSDVVTPHGRFRLHCLPVFFPRWPSVADDAAARLRFHAYATTATFERQPILHRIEKVEPGESVRRDRLSAFAELDWHRARLEERLLRSGDPVVVLGELASDRGIVAGPAEGAVIHRGSAAELARTLGRDLFHARLGVAVFLGLGLAAVGWLLRQAG